MLEVEYPALYQAASAASTKAQRAYLRCIKWYSGLALLGATLTSYGVESRGLAIAAAIAFAGGLFLSVLITVKKYENTWYRARAIAESIKTSSWRLIMKAEPFDGELSPNDAKVQFTTLLQKILKEHKDLAAELGGDVSQRSQLTDSMLTTRNLNLFDRKRFYQANRISEQRKWYAGKSRDNIKYGQVWFWVLVALQFFAISFSVARIVEPTWHFLPTEVFVVAGTSVLGWIQVKRYRELAAAYALTAHEIGLAQAELESVLSNEEFSKFVGDTENAFSREHTQWIARKD